MTKVISKKFGNHLAQQLIESISEPANTVYYLTASRHTEYDDGDDTVPTPVESSKELDIDIYEQMIFGKKITTNDVIRMIPRHNWTSNTKYAMYDHTDGSLFTKQFYAVVDGGSTYFVYKVLDNNNGAASTEEPTNTSESACSFVTTADGYRWKLMYKMSDSTFEKFATDDYIPVATSANVAGNTISGAIDVIKLANNGSNYVSTLTGQFTADDLRESIPTISGNTTTYRLNANAASNSDFYVGSSLYITSGTGAGQIKKILSYTASTRVITIEDIFDTPPSTDSLYTVNPNVVIVGDGSGACAYATVASNSTVNNYVSGITMVSRGSGYTYATATVVGNTGGVSNTASATVIIPPKNGHGSDAPTELGSAQMGISVTFATSESGFITTENDFRKIGILKDPLFNDVILTLGDESGTFTSGETVYQVSYRKLTGTANVATSTTTVTGSSTEFNQSLQTGDQVIIFDTANSLQCLRTVSAVTNSTSFTVNAAPDFNTGFAVVAHTTLHCSGKKSGNSSPYINLSNTEPKFVTNRKIIGTSSGAMANVTAISVQEKSYNSWNTFDNRTRISYTANTAAFTEDDVVYQDDVSISNAYFHSANSTYVFLTSEKGPINADPNSPLQTATVNYTLGSTKYNPDVVKRSGELIYIENSSPITRSSSQSETIRIVLEF